MAAGIKTQNKKREAAVDASFRRALKLFRTAAHRVPAYKDFLKRAKIDPEKIRTPSDFAQVPTTDKPNYISRYSLAEMSLDGTLRDAKFISSSSGSTGVPLYWPRGNVQNDIAGEFFERIYEHIFETREGTTLCVNLFALGTWIAGLEFYNGAKHVADRGSVMAVATPGIEKTVAIDCIKQLGPSYRRIVLAGYPPFVKDVIESGIADGFDWKGKDVRLLTGGEAFGELWRERVLGLVGKNGSLDSFVNVYGMAETGVTAHETPLTVYLRQQVAHLSALEAKFLHEGELSALYQYDPLRRYFEVGEDDTLVLTSEAGMPLIRYNTRDRGGLLAYEDVAPLAKADLKRTGTDMNVSKWRLPFVYLFGRRDLSISLYALNIYVENIKHALDTWHESKYLSGLFTMRVGHTRGLDQQFELVIELARGTEPTSALGRQIGAHTVATLRKINTEYAKLHSTVGRRAIPKIKLVRYGEIDTMPGRKHKWVRRG